MASDDADALLRKVRAQHRSVSFVTGSELVNIDLGDDSYRQGQDSQLNETVRKHVLLVQLKQKLSLKTEVFFKLKGSLFSRNFFLLDYW